MPTREHVINKLRSIGYAYRKETENTSQWRKGTHRVFVPKNVLLADAWVRATLRQCGLAEDEIDTFLGTTR